MIEMYFYIDDSLNTFKQILGDGCIKIKSTRAKFHQLLVKNRINLQGEFWYFKSQIVFDFDRSNRFFEFIKIKTVCAITTAKIEQIFIETVAKLLMSTECILQNDYSFKKFDKRLIIGFQIFDTISCSEFLIRKYVSQKLMLLETDKINIRHR